MRSSRAESSSWRTSSFGSCARLTTPTSRSRSWPPRATSGVRVGVVYDLGHATPRFTAQFADLDILLLESNHDDDMLWTGRYPWVVKQRIAGPRGHLSNADAGIMARACAHRGLRHLVLCHLSENNNTPAVALRAMGNALHGSPFRGTLVAAAQDTPISVNAARSRSPRQLSLAL